MENKEIKRVAFYIRVSTDEQVKDWYGLDFQKDSLKDLVKFKENHNPIWTTNEKHWYEDEWCSGWDLNRPNFKAMMQAAKNKEFDIIAVWKIDRMSRNLSHLLTIFEELKKYEVSFYSLKENIDFSGPVWRLTFQIFWALAEFEREMIKSRTLEGKRASARRGNYIWNGIPYWYDRKEKTDNKKWTKLKIVKKEAKIMEMIFDWFVFEKNHYALIARRLNELWIAKWVASKQKNKNTQWIQSTIKRMLQNTTYVWKRIEKLKDDDWKIDEIEVNTPIIIKENIFDYAQIRIKELENEKIENIIDDEIIYIY